VPPGPAVTTEHGDEGLKMSNRKKRKGYVLLPALIDRPGRYAAEEDPRLIVGDHVKLGFKAQKGWPRAEWMFCQVTAVIGTWPEVSYRGELRNMPFYVRGLAPGAPVEFEPGHVYQVIHDSPGRPEEERRRAETAFRLETFAFTASETQLDRAIRECRAEGKAALADYFAAVKKDRAGYFAAVKKDREDRGA
jgi:hypothetical protein